VAKVFKTLEKPLTEFISAQRLFFVATAPLARGGHVNLSPKGLDSFRIVDPTTVAYLDFTGSGIETVSHVRENGRIVVMFCALEGPPKILRLHGRAEVIEPDDPRFGDLVTRFPPSPGARAIILIALERIADSCGYGVPRYRYEGERSQLPAWAQRQGTKGLDEYRAKNNRMSIDGVPGLRGTASEN